MIVVTDRQPVSLLGAVEIRRLADELDLRPTKSLGQNFVHDGNTVRRIVAAADLRSTDHVLEVGPGLGSLTLGLLDAVAAVTAVEIDPRLAGLLPRTVAGHAPGRLSALQVMNADALEVTADRLAVLDPQIAAPTYPDRPGRQPALQRRGAGAAASAGRGADAASCAGDGAGRGRGPARRRSGIEDLRVAQRENRVVRRRPPRRFDQQVGVLAGARASIPPWSPSSGSRFPGTGDRAAVFAVIDAAFAQRRKTLRSALAEWAGSAAYAETVLTRARVDPSARGEVLGVDEFIRIAAALEAIDAVEHE